MEVLALAGGTPPGPEDGLCCLLYPVLPVVLWLAVLAVARDSLRAASLSLMLAALPFLMLLCLVAGYEPSSDPDVQTDHDLGRHGLGFYACLLAVSGLSLLWVACKRLVRRGRKEDQLPPTLSTPAPGGPGA